MKKHLEAERARLIAHEEVLKNSNSHFLRTKDNLAHDPDTLAVYARQFGYGAPNEQFVRIKGLTVAMNNSVPMDKALYAAGPNFVSDQAIKIISALFGFAVLVFLLINDFYILKGMFLSR